MREVGLGGGLDTGWGSGKEVEGSGRRILCLGRGV